MGNNISNDRYIVSSGCCNLFGFILVIKEKGEDDKSYSYQCISITVGGFFRSIDPRIGHQEYGSKL